MIYEMREIERKVRVWRVDADSKEQAQIIHDRLNLPKESWLEDEWPIETEEAQPWTAVKDG